MTTPPQPPPASHPGLAFSRPVFAKLSPHPYLLRNLTAAPSPARTNGRAPHEARPVDVNTASLSHAHGSALVRVGDTTVVCGVRGELLPVERIPQFRPVTRSRRRGDRDGSGGDAGGDDEAGQAFGRGELREYDLLVPNVELATGSAPQFLPGAPPTPLAQTLATRVYSLLHATGVVGAEDLRVWYGPGSSTAGEDTEMRGAEDEGQQEEEGGQEESVVAYWVLYIDVQFLSFDGNPFDAVWTAVVAALRNTRLPVARWDSDREMVVCSRAEKRALNVRGLPVACSAAVFMEKELSEAGGGAGEGRHWILLDPDRLEETLCREVITMVVDCSNGETRIKSLEKQGGTVLGRELVRGYAGVAEGRWKEVKEALG